MTKITDDNLDEVIELYIETVANNLSVGELHKRYTNLLRVSYDGIDSATLEHEIKHSEHAHILEKL